MREKDRSGPGGAREACWYSPLRAGTLLANARAREAVRACKERVNECYGREEEEGGTDGAGGVLEEGRHVVRGLKAGVT